MTSLPDAVMGIAVAPGGDTRAKSSGELMTSRVRAAPQPTAPMTAAIAIAAASR
jgi:hypothetical protein